MGLNILQLAVAQQLYTSELKVNCNMHTLLFVSISEAAGMHMLQCSCELAGSLPDVSVTVTSYYHFYQ